jgi:hypothetical protein
VSRGVVEIVVVFFDIFSVIAFGVCESKEPLFQDWILEVPHSDRKAERLLVIRNAGDAVLTPSIRTRTRLIVTEVVPGISVFAVVFTNCANWRSLR